MQRREFANLSVTGVFLSLLAQKSVAHHTGKPHQSVSAKIPQPTATRDSTDAHAQAMQKHEAFGEFPEAVIGLVVYPGMFLQDLVGPLSVFESLLNRKIHLLWKTLDPQPTHSALVPIKPTTTFEQCPKTLDVLFVPGGVPGTQVMMEDKDVMAFLKRMAPRSKFVTSVCTGSFILGAAGLLDGFRAATYWALSDLLREVGAIPSNERVCVDRNRITGGGVTAGIDFGLEIAARLTSPLYAQAIQLYLEYAPAPPFNAGRPDTAPAQARAFLTDMYAGLRQSTREIAQRVRSDLLASERH